MTQTMKAARYYGPQDLRIEQTEVPAPGPGQVRLKNAYVGICGSDLHMYYAPPAPEGVQPQPHPLTGATLPQILGHEFSGVVDAVGEGVTDYQVGERVTVFPLYSCGECAACRLGRPNACKKIAFHGLSSHGGGMAAYTTVLASMLHRLPDNVDLKMGALVEPMAVAWHAVRRSGVQPGQSALIIGGGPIGIGLYLSLRAQGVERVLLSEPSPSRRAIAEGLGAQTINPTNADLPAAVTDLTDGLGADVAFDAAGVGPAVLAGLMALTPGGKMVIVAIHGKGVDFNPSMLVMRETEVLGALAYLPQDFDEVLAAMSEGKFNPESWVDLIGMDEIVNSMQEMHAGRGMKYMVNLAKLNAEEANQ